MPIPSQAEPLVSVPTRKIIADRLRAWISEGTLAPREILRDSEIAASLGLSRTPVREALLQLELDGLVETTPQRWTRVAALDRSDLEALYPVLIDLEALAARLAAERGTSNLAEIEAAHEAFAHLDRSLAGGDSHPRAIRRREADDRFHHAILQAADNAYVTRSLLPLKLHARRFENLYFGSAAATVHASATDHQQILVALQTGDPDGAAEATRLHWQRSLRALHDRYEKSAEEKRV
jgi:DNA-binding GntR family transcriptional regulator